MVGHDYSQACTIKDNGNMRYRDRLSSREKKHWHIRERDLHERYRGVKLTRCIWLYDVTVGKVVSSK